MSDEPFPGSAADFYERNQVLLQALSECAQNNADLKSLITELADALEKPYSISDDHEDKLIQRAREAAK